MALTPQAAYLSLTSSPKTFLKSNSLRIFGSLSSDIHMYVIEKHRNASHRPGKVFKTRWMTECERFEMKNLAQYRNGIQVNVHFPFSAHVVHMQNSGNPIVFYRLPFDGPNLMITGQISGCSFIMDPIPGSQDLNVAHIRPAPGQSRQLKLALENQYPNATVYGASLDRGYYNENNRVISVVGVRKNGIWKIYTQKQDPANQEYQVRSVWQQYPQRKKI